MYFLPFSRPGLDTQPVSRGLVTKIKTIRVKLKDDKYKNITWPTIVIRMQQVRKSMYKLTKWRVREIHLYKLIEKKYSTSADQMAFVQI
jgi:hypothetical protein